MPRHRHVMRRKQPPSVAALPVTRMNTSASLTPGRSLGTPASDKEEENMANYTLPDLPYDYAALEPHISGTIMELHHSQAPPGVCHRREHRPRAARRGARLGQPRERQQAREGPRVQPRRPRQPLDLLDEPVARRRRQARPASSQSAIDDHFGSFDKFQAHFTAAALGVQGSGWAVLALGLASASSLIIQQFFDQQGNIAGRHRPAAACSTSGSTRTTSTTRTSGPTTSRRSGTSRTGRTSSSASTAAREKTSGLLVLS